jgi:L-alanine-DL-glutamate epimerase-like enolase superfamily enzyme
VAIVRGTAFSLRFPFSPRRGPSVAWGSEHAYALLRLEDADGAVGWGETYLVTGAAAALEAAWPVLRGRRPEAAAAILADARRATEHPYATSAVAIALDDLRARRLGVRVADLYGGVRRDRVQAYAASGGYREGEPTEAVWTAEVREAIGQGYRAFKLRIGRGSLADEAPIIERLVRDAPPGFLWLADGNGGFDHGRAVAMGRVLADLGFVFFEEPMDQWGGYAGYERLARDLPLPLAGGEILFSRAAAKDLLGRAGVSIVQPEPVICGGVGELLFIAALAALDGVPCVPHTSNGAIGIAAAMSAIACLPPISRSPAERLPLLEIGLDENPWRTDVASLPPVGSDGWITLPDGPGLGVDVEEAFVRRRADAVLELR